MAKETQGLDFKISSRLKTIIGKELITDDLIAIFELVKNSYDANAKSVKIVFQNIKEENRNKGPKILIIDDGDGMSYDDLTNKWLFVGYSAKEGSEKELEGTNFRDKITERKRIFAGAKGIGRFSCDRLGSKLNLYTKKDNENFFHQLYLNWEEFEEDPKKEFHQIKAYYNVHNDIKIEGYEYKDFSKGTILEITSLRDGWNKEKLVKLKRYLQRLINPVQVGKDQEFKIFLDVDEYKEDDIKDNEDQHKYDFEVINGEVKNIVFEKLGIKTTQINCSIDEKGNKITTELIDKGELIFHLKEQNEFLYLKNINIAVFYLNRSAKLTFTKMMGLVPKNFGSIFMYKNGFRVHPYGDEDNDWLGLDRRKTQGWKRNLGNRELMGRVEINGDQPHFKEVSSRAGGVIETPAYNQLLILFIKKLLPRLEKYVVDALDWDDADARPKSPDDIKKDTLKLLDELVGQVKDPDKELKFNPNLLGILKEKQIEKIPELIKNIESLKKSVKNPKERKYMEKQIRALGRTTKNVVKTKTKEVELLKKDFKQVEKENLFLTAIAGEDKKDILALQHQIGLSTSSINYNLIYLKDKITKEKTISNQDLINVIEQISLQTQKIASIVKFVTKANFDLTGTDIENDLVAFIKQYVENVYTHYEEIAVDNRNVSIKVNSPEDFEFIFRFKPLEFIIIIDNMINNSIKAKATNIELNLNKLNETGMELKIKDDGKGIPPEIMDKIFNFGFTTTDGSGIGLYHVQQIVKKMNGSVDVNRSVEKGAEFIIKVVKLN